MNTFSRAFFRFAMVFTMFNMWATSAHAFLWFGEDPNDMPPQQQTELSLPAYNKALEAQSKGKLRSALKNFKNVYEDYPASDYAAISLFNYGEIQFNRKKWKKSFEAFQKVLAWHPSFPRFNEVIDYQYKIALASAEGDHVRFAGIIPYRAFNRAVAYFETIVNNAPYSEEAPLALMNVALIRQHKGETAAAIDALDRLINNYPNSLLADDAYLSLAETFATLVQGPEYDQGATREAMSYFEDFLILFSKNDKVSEAEKGLEEMEDVYARSKLILGQYYFKYRRWYQAAEIFFNEAITAAPDSPAAATAREFITRIEEIRARNEANAQSDSDKKKEESFIKRFFKRIVS